MGKLAEFRCASSISIFQYNMCITDVRYSEEIRKLSWFAGVKLKIY